MHALKKRFENKKQETVLISIGLMGCMYVIHVSMNSYCQCDQFGKIKFLNVIFLFCRHM